MNGDGVPELAARLRKNAERCRNKADYLLTVVRIDPINTDTAKGLIADAADFDSAATLLEHIERVPRDAIEKLLSEAMDRAVANGANSASMPDEYVEIAAWLCGVRSKE